MFFPTNTSIRLALTFELIENNYFLFNYWCSFICTDTAIIDLCLYYKIRIVQTHLVLFCFVDLQRHWKYNTLCIFIVSIAESVDHLLKSSTLYSTFLYYFFNHGTFNASFYTIKSKQNVKRHLFYLAYSVHVLATFFTPCFLNCRSLPDSKLKTIINTF